MIKGKISGFTILGVILVVFNIIMFVIPVEKNAVFWLSYGFTTAAFLLQIAVFADAFGKAYTMKSRFLGLPLAYVGISHLVLQLIVCFIFTALANIVAPWVVVIVYVVLLGFTLISLVLVDVGRDEIVRIDEKAKAKVFFIKSLQIDVEMLFEQLNNEQLKEMIQILTNAIKYSDPMSSEELYDLESNIESKVSELKKISHEDIESASSLIEEINLLILERNKKCKLLK